jgi:hypothetical protein
MLFIVTLCLFFWTKGVFGGCLCQNSAETNYWANGTPDNTAETPINTTIAFFGDQGLSQNAVSVLQLVLSENAEAVIHVGDFDYVSSPSQWDELISNNLGEQFPYYSVLGNHDAVSFSMPNGYQQKIAERLERNELGTFCRGDVGYSYVCSYKGIVFALTNPGLFQSGSTAANFIKDAMATFGGKIRISGWHLVQTLYQVEAKTDESTFDVYEQSRKNGAFVVTAHCHNYARSVSMVRLNEKPLFLIEETNTIKAGQTVVNVVGTGGDSIRSCVSNFADANWWAKTGCNNNMDFGALFCKFNYNNNSKRAFCYFKQINGEILDQYIVEFDNPTVVPGPVDCNCTTSDADSLRVLSTFSLLIGCFFALF